MHAMGSVEIFLRSKDDLKLASFGGGRPETRELQLTKQPSPSLSPSHPPSHQQGRHAILISVHILILLFFFRLFVFPKKNINSERQGPIAFVRPVAKSFS